MSHRFLSALLIVVTVSSCVTTQPKRKRTHRPPREPATAVVSAPQGPPPAVQVVDCAAAKPMRVHFYDVGQALAVLVELPTGQLILVDAGESEKRPGCGPSCADWHQHFMSKLHDDVGDREISLMWNTHPHSDHMGGAVAVLKEFKVAAYADNETLRGKAWVQKVLETAADRGTVAELTTAEAPAAQISLSANLSVRGVLPSGWPVNCETKPNDCSAGLRVDYCQSSVLFVGDAEAEEELLLPVTHADVLQVGHHGSNTSSSPELLSKATPKWAVISSGKRGEGTNKGYCHPRASTVEALSKVLGSPGGKPIDSFGGDSCKFDEDSMWRPVPTSTRLFSTARDGDVTLMTTGNGEFVRE